MITALFGEHQRSVTALLVRLHILRFALSTQGAAQRNRRVSHMSICGLLQ